MCIRGYPGDDYYSLRGECLTSELPWKSLRMKDKLSMLLPCSTRFPLGLGI
jgi:hypothetical protein